MANMEPLVLGVRIEAEGLEEFDAVNHAVEKQKKVVRDTLKRLKEYKETVGMTADALQLYKLRQNGATEAQIKEAAELQRLINLEKKAIDQKNKMNGSLRLVRGGFGQLGHQVQDVAVQLQGGTDAMIVLGQQGGQIASLMGSGGALFGAFIAVGAAAYTAFRDVEVAENKFDELKTTLQNLVPATNQAAVGISTALEGIRAAQLSEARGKLDKLVDSMENQVEVAEKGLRIKEKEGRIDNANVNPMQAQLLARNATMLATEAFQEQTQAVEQNLAQFQDLVAEIESLGGSVENATRPELVKRIRALQKALRGEGEEQSPLAFTPEEVQEGRKGIEEIARSLMSQKEKIQADYNKMRSDLVANFTAAGEMGSQRFMQMYRDINAAQTAAINEIDQREAEQAEREQARADAKAKAAERAAQREIDAKARAVSTLEALQRSDVTDIDKINKRYDAELDRARKAAKDRVDLAQMLADTEVAIEEKRSAAILALREREKQKHFDNVTKMRENALGFMRDETENYINNLMLRQQALDQALEQKMISETEHAQGSMRLEEMKAEHLIDQQLKIIGGFQNVENAIVNASHAFVTGAANGTEAMRMLGRAIMDELIKSIVQMGVEKAKQAIIAKNIEAGSLAASVAANTAAMTAIATASAPAAAMVSLATMGGNSIPAQAGITSTVGVAKASALASFEGGGFTGHGARSGGMDGKGGFLAMLHPNETVTDHTKGQGQGITIVNNIQTSGDGDVDQKIAAAVTEASQQTVQQVHNMMRRGRM